MTAWHVRLRVAFTGEHAGVEATYVYVSGVASWEEALAQATAAAEAEGFLVQAMTSLDRVVWGR